MSVTYPSQHLSIYSSVQNGIGLRFFQCKKLSLVGCHLTALDPKWDTLALLTRQKKEHYLGVIAAIHMDTI